MICNNIIGNILLPRWIQLKYEKEIVTNKSVNWQHWEILKCEHFNFSEDANNNVSHNLVKARISCKNVFWLIQLNRIHNFNKIFVLINTNLISLLKASIVFILQCKSLGCDQLPVIDHDLNKYKCRNIPRHLDDKRILHISFTPDRALDRCCDPCSKGIIGSRLLLSWQ